MSYRHFAPNGVLVQRGRRVLGAVVWDGPTYTSTVDGYVVYEGENRDAAFKALS